MKKFYAFLLISVTAVNLCSAASYITKNGIRYVYNTKKTAVSVASPASGKTYVGDIVIPATITNSSDEVLPVVGVNSSAFSETTVTSVILPESVTSIGDYAFDSCENLKKVEMPGVKTFGNWSFRNCYELEGLKFPEGLTTIGNYTFDKNYKMTEVELPSTVTNLGGYVFEGNPQLTSVTCHAAVAPAVKKGYLDGDEIWTIFDDNDYGDRILYVPAESIEEYSTTLGWHQFGSNIKAIETGGVESVLAGDKGTTVAVAGAGSVAVTLAAYGRIVIADLNGRVIRDFTAAAGTTVVSGLPSGCLIVNGIKVILK